MSQMKNRIALSTGSRLLLLFATMLPLVPAQAQVQRGFSNLSFEEPALQTPGCRVTYAGETRIAGVPGSAAPVVLNFADAVGGATGKLLPTGQARDVIAGVAVTCLDVAMPVVIARAADFGKTALESAKELDADRDFMARIEVVRRAASLAMGMGDAAGKVMPKFTIIGGAGAGGAVAARYFTPVAAHEAMAVTGGICIASACKLSGTVAEGIARVSDAVRETVVIEHPSGVMETVISTARASDGSMTILGGGTLRTARRIMVGHVFIP